MTFALSCFYSSSSFFLKVRDARTRRWFEFLSIKLADNVGSETLAAAGGWMDG